MWSAWSLVTCASMVILLQGVRSSTANALIEPFPENGSIALSDCPSWLLDYIAFHNNTRGEPDAKYLVFLGTPAGLGDVLRGLKYAVKLSAATQRVLLITDVKTSGSKDGFTGDLLVPSLIDWTMKEEDLGLTREQVEASPVVDIRDDNKDDLSEEFEVVVGAQRVVRMYSDMPEWPPDILPLPNTSALNITSMNGEDASCMHCTYSRDQIIGASCTLRAVFKASKGLIEEYNSVTKRMFDTSTPGNHIAVHLRLGGFSDTHYMEDYIDRSTDDDNVKKHPVLIVLRTLMCAQKAARNRNITAPVVLLTDNTRLRKLLWQKKFGQDVVTTPFEAMHILYAFERNKTADPVGSLHVAYTVYVDLMLMMGAECLFAPTYSGFNHQARLWAANECFNPYRGCKRYSEKEILRGFYQF